MKIINISIKQIIAIFFLFGLTTILISCSEESEPLLPPEAAFSYEVNDFTVKFFTQTKNVDDYSWDFGDENTNLTSNPIHIYENSGSYTVILIATGNGASVKVQKTIEISVPPEVSFSYSVDDFTATFESEIENAESYEWDFGDESTSDDENPVHTYGNPGKYAVMLAASSYGGTVSSKDTIEIEEPLSVSFEYEIKDYTVNFTPDKGNLEKYAWDFGDTNSSTETSPEHIYSKGGDYTVKLTAISEGDTAVTTNKITIVAPKPTIELSVEVDPNNSNKVNITVNTTFVDSYSWDYGDGNTSTEEGSHSYIYKASGEYTIEVTVEGEGGTATDSQTFVAASAPGLSYMPNTVAVGTSGSISGAISGSPATYEITDNGDADFVTVNATTGEISIAAESTTGVYNVVVKATNSVGTDETTAEITIGINSAFDPTGKGYEWKFYMNQDEPWRLEGTDGEVAEQPFPFVDIPTGWPANWPTPTADWADPMYLTEYLALGLVADLLMQVPSDIACAAVEESGDQLYFEVEDDLTLKTICHIGDDPGQSVQIGTSTISWADGEFSWALNLESQIPLTYIIDNPTVETFIDPLEPDNGGVPPRVYSAIRGMVEQFITPTDVADESSILTSLTYKKVEVILEVFDLLKSAK